MLRIPTTLQIPFEMLYLIEMRPKFSTSTALGMAAWECAETYGRT